MAVGMVLLAPSYEPIVLAEQIGTLAAFAQGPFIVTFAAGGRALQFDAFGMEMKTRTRRLEEVVTIVRGLLAGEFVSYEGRYHRLNGVAVGPLPVKPVALWVAGTTRSSAARAGRWGDGWLTAGAGTREELAAQLEADDIHVPPSPFAPDGLIVDEGYPLRDSAIEAGMFFVQDEASQLVALLAGERPPLRVLDACASPGGKTTAIAAAMEGRGLLVATDLRDRRLDLLRKTVAASGAANVRIVQADLRKPLPFASPFDCVLVDAPCSGLGTLRRDPDIRWRRRESDLIAQAAAELTMLQRAAEIVAPGGRLIYATCSSEPEENEGIADAFLATAPEFRAVDASETTTRLPAAVIDARGHLRTQPHVHRLEAFFGAVFERRF